MKVSIIIPCHNYGHFLPDSLNSILHQTYPNWEVLIIDDGSTDATSIIAENFLAKDPRIKYFRQEKGGVSKARNLGISKSTGDFIQFLDADDMISPEKIEIQLEAFANQPDLDLCYTENFYFRDGNPNQRYLDQEFQNREWFSRFSGSGEYAIAQLIENNLAVISSPMITKKLALKTGGFSETSTHCEDWKFWFQCVFEGAKIKFIHNPEAYTLIRVHGRNTSQNQKTMQYGELELRRWMDKKLATVDYLSPLQRIHLQKLNKERTTVFVKNLIYSGPLPDSRQLLAMSKYFPWHRLFIYFLKAVNRKRKLKNRNRRHPEPSKLY